MARRGPSRRVLAEPCSGEGVQAWSLYISGMPRIVEVRHRGFTLEGLPSDTAHAVMGLCSLMSSRLIEAALAIDLYEDATRQVAALLSVEMEERHAREDAERELVREREAELGLGEMRVPGLAWTPEVRRQEGEIREQAEREVLHAKWHKGAIPQDYIKRGPFLHARSFVSSVAQIERVLRELKCLSLGDADAEIAAAHTEMTAAIPGLKKVRDSSEHAATRVQGKRKYDKRLDLQPVDNNMIHAPHGNVLIVESLHGNRFGGTIEDGSYADVEVSDATLEAARAAIQRALDALPWRDIPGVPRHWTPRR